MADQAIYSPMRVLDGNGDPVPGALVTFYASGTLTLIDVWQDAAGAVAATNPVVADGDGNLPQRFVGQAAKAVITDALGVTIRTIDPVPIMPSSFGAASTTSFSPSASLPVSNVQAAVEMVDDKVAGLGEAYLRFDAEQILSGPETTQAWENLYLGALAGKSKISVPGDINSIGGTPYWWTFLAGDGHWRGMLGWSQVWTSVTRTPNTVYQNTTNRPIMIAISGTGNFTALWAGGLNPPSMRIAYNNASGSGTNEQYHISAIIPPDYYYELRGNYGDVLELR